MDGPGDESVPKIHVFTALDHSIFAGMLVLSALIGIYFAFFAKQKQNTKSEYLMGGKNMGIAPVSLSLIASFISGIILLGVPAEIYVYGTQFATALFAIIGASVGCGLLILPVFHGLQLTTSYQYLEVRYDRKVRLLGSLLFIINFLQYIPIVIYAPALAFTQVTGINLHLITALVSFVCIFYTTLGGLKAVVWTDTLQTAMIFFSLAVVVVLGTKSVGGFDTVWKRNEDSGRIEFFNLDPDPTTRHTLWNTTFGFIFNWIVAFSIDQGMVQRFLTLPTIRKARISLIIFTLGSVIITGMSCYCGLLMYATYHDCDRLSAKVVGDSDQLMPYYVMDVTGSLPGLSGLFIAGLFSAALSTMSTGLNSMSGVIFEDFINPFLKVSEARASHIMKAICALVGVLCVCMVFVVENVDGIMQANLSLAGITNGPVLALFLMGMLIPWVNSKGAIAGSITGLLVAGVISFGSQWSAAKGQIKFDGKPISTDGCFFPLNASIYSELGTAIINETYLPKEMTRERNGNESLENTIISDITKDPRSQGDGEAWYLFRISYTLYAFMGLVISMAVGLTVSFLTGSTNPADVHIELLSPVVRPLFAHRCKSGDEAAHWKHKEERHAPGHALNDLTDSPLAEEDNLLQGESITLMVHKEGRNVKNTD